MGRIKGKGTGVQPYYHEKKLIVRQNRFDGITNFGNTGIQFEWLIISIIPVLSKEHRNTYATCNAEKASYFIRKITIYNIKEAVGTTTKLYDLTEFDDQLTIFRQYCAYTTNTLSTNTFLDFSNNREIKNNMKRENFFTDTTAKRLYINLRDSFGVTGKKDPLKRSDESIS